MSGPLADLKVLDLSRFVAGPWCAMLLGDLGADVVKVEKPGEGEDIRRAPPRVGGDSLFAIVFNRNKRSLTLDFRNERGQELLRELAARADVLVENFRPGVMEAMGCGWEVLKARNPRLIMARISGYGQEGPDAGRPSFDAIAQAESGLMAITGAPDGPPTLVGTTIVDHAAGLHAAVGILSALEARHRTGRGQVVEVALLDSALSLLMTAIPRQALLGEATERTGNRDRFGAPANTFPTADGALVYIVAGGEERYARFARAAGLDALLEDPRFADNDLRLANADVLEGAITAWTRTRDAADIVALMAEARVPCGKVCAIAEVLANPQLRHRRQIVEVEHADAGPVPMQGFVAKLSETPAALTGSVPKPGQHNEQVLADWLGYGAEALRDLAAAGAL
jgi:crotonobetainyl-CoA:carnitine CoA-transferase CaiB-like acyl-CoA transferase